MASKPRAIKLVVVGDSTVGKTSLLTSYHQKKPQNQYVPSIFDHCAETIIVDNQQVNLRLWDSSGHQTYNRLRSLSYTNCDVFLIVFSVVEPESFINAQKKWYPQLQQIVGNVPKIFVGNKIDLRNENENIKKDPRDRHIMKQTALEIIEKEFKCKYMQCSDFTYQGVKEIFDEAVRAVLRKRIKPRQSDYLNDDDFLEEIRSLALKQSQNSCCNIM